MPFVDLDGQARLVASCAAVLRPFVSLLLDTGLRRGEALALEWRDVDLGRTTLTVRQSKNKSPREIPLTARLAASLKEMRDRRTIPLDGPDRVFSWLPQSFPGEFSTLFRAATNAAQLPALRIHDCRHLFAVNLVRAGTPLPDVGKMLGHKTLAMVLRYGHHSPADATFRARDRLEAYLAASSVTATPRTAQS